MGQDVKEIRVPKTFASIAGFCALSRKTVAIKNAYDGAELGQHHPSLKFDARWDKASNFRTSQVLASPILFEKYLLGVLQLINKRGAGTFTPKDEEAAEELAKILGIAFYNQHRAARTNKPTKYGHLIDKGLISEKDIEKAVTNARVNQMDVAKILEDDFQIPKDEIGKALSQFYSCPYWEPKGRTIPDDIKGRVNAEVLKKNTFAPIEKKEGTLFVADSYLRQVVQLDRDGNLLRTIAHDDLQRPSSVAFDARRQRLYVGDSKAHVIHVFDEQGHRVGTLGGVGAGPGQFNSPTHLALAPDGSVVVTDALNFRVEVFGPDGQYTDQLGKIGDGAGNFAAPKGVAVDRDGHIYVVDAMFDAVQVFNAKGRLLLGFGEQGNRAGQFWLPNGLYIDAGQQLFVADAYNRRIQVFQILSPPGGPSDVERGSGQ
jgi:sugar lactone lactonase YvrE